MSTSDEPRRGKTRRLMALFLLVSLAALFVAACGDDDDDGGSTNASSSSSGDVPEWCGDEKVTLGIQDGGGLNDWSKQSFEQVQAAVEDCPNIEDTIVVNAGFDPQKAVSGMQGMIAQGANALSARAPGSRKRSLLRSDPVAMRATIGNSRSAEKPTT